MVPGPLCDQGGTNRDEDSVSSTLLLLVGSIYLIVAAGYYRAGRWGMCLAFVCYAGANIGFALDAR